MRLGLDEAAGFQRKRILRRQNDFIAFQSMIHVVGQCHLMGIYRENSASASRTARAAEEQAGRPHGVERGRRDTRGLWIDSGRRRAGNDNFRRADVHCRPAAAGSGSQPEQGIQLQPAPSIDGEQAAVLRTALAGGEKVRSAGKRNFRTLQNLLTGQHFKPAPQGITRPSHRCPAVRDIARHDLGTLLLAESLSWQQVMYAGVQPYRIRAGQQRIVRGQQGINARRQARYAGEIHGVSRRAVETGVLLPVARGESARITRQDGIGMGIVQDIARAPRTHAELVGL